MRKPTRLKRLWRIGFPLCGWLSLVLFILAACGVSLPIPLTKDLSTPFPCMYGQCGCRNAAQCWENCCCHTASERLAWAKANGVEPPASLVAKVQTESGASECSSAGCPTRATACTTPNCLPARQVTQSKKGCCAADENAPRADSAVAPSPAHDAGLSVIAALKCGGNYHGVAAVPIGLPLAANIWRPEAPCLGHIALPLEFTVSWHSSPRVPPPRTNWPIDRP